MNNDYVLVKDKSGQFKYFKDGKFYSPKEVKALTKNLFAKPTLSKSALSKNLLTNQLATGTHLESRRGADQKIVEDKTKSVIEKLKIKFSDDKIKNRFVNVLITYFRGIRTKKEVEYVLTLPKISGGLELPADKAKIIIVFLENLAMETERERKNIAALPIEKHLEKKIADFQHQLEPAPLAIIKPAIKFNYSSPLPPKFVPVKTMPKPPVAKPLSAPKPIVQKPRINDIKFNETHLVGPLEELGEMDMADFRRLGKNQKEICDEILEKIDLLSEQSFAKKRQGIKAWKSSPVFQMYLSMNMEGILQNKSISDVIKFRQIENKDTLTLGEYETINEISRKISS